MESLLTSFQQVVHEVFNIHKTFKYNEIGGYLKALQQHFRLARWEDVWLELAQFFVEEEIDLALRVYSAIFIELRSMPVVESQMRIVVEMTDEGEIDVVGRNGLRWRDIEGVGEGHPNADDEVDQALEFQGWTEIVSMEVINSSGATSGEIVAQCLYRMTFFGFTAEGAEMRASYGVIVPN